MIKPALKNIVGKGKPAGKFLQSLSDEFSASISIEDHKGNILFGEAAPNSVPKYPIVFDGESIGWVKGKAGASLVADLLVLLMQKESEKKNLVAEVLNLYQEVNLIFNFSEKLAQTIDPPAIAETTLAEAVHIIPSDNGVIVLWDEASRQLEVISRFGDLFFHKESIHKNFQLLGKIILNGQSEIMNDISSLKEREIILPGVRSVMYAALKVKHRVMGAVILASTSPAVYTAGHLKLLTTLALQSSAAIESALLYEKNIKEAREREEAMRRVHDVTRKFVPYEFIRSLGHDLITDVKLGDQVEKVVTVLFADIREYTTLSESMTPEENFSFICAFNEKIGPVVRNNDGFINQYLGDAIMAIFPGDPSGALTAAVEMQIAMQEFNKQRELSNQSTIQIGIGLHTGPLIMGITGDHERMDATTISDTVNTASRLESLTKVYKASIIVSESTLQKIPARHSFNLRHLGIVQLKGKHASLSIHECFSGIEINEALRKRASLVYFSNGITSYLRSSFDEAVVNFQTVIDADPNDLTARHFLNNAKRYLNEGIPANWMGVEKIASK
ncbi:hypothetical protein BH20BAC1_BH20BAC1_03350 [soil metagenome]